LQITNLQPYLTLTSLLLYKLGWIQLNLYKSKDPKVKFGSKFISFNDSKTFTQLKLFLRSQSYRMLCIWKIFIKIKIP